MSVGRRQSLDVRRRIELRHPDRLPTCQLDRAGQPCVPRGHVRPDVRREGQPTVLGGQVDRVDVASAPLDDHDLVGDLTGHAHRRAPPGTLEHHRAAGVAPRATGVVEVAEAVGEQVEPRAGPDLEQPHRQRVPGDSAQQTAVQRGRPADLVRLRRLVQQRPYVVRASREEVDHRGDARRGPVPARGRVEGRELVGLPGQHEPVDAAGQAEGEPGRTRVVLVAAQHPRGRSAPLDVVGEPLEQLGVHRRAEMGAGASPGRGSVRAGSAPSAGRHSPVIGGSPRASAGR